MSFCQKCLRKAAEELQEKRVKEGQEPPFSRRGFKGSAGSEPPLPPFSGTLPTPCLLLPLSLPTANLPPRHSHPKHSALSKQTPCPLPTPLAAPQTQNVLHPLSPLSPSPPKEKKIDEFLSWVFWTRNSIFAAMYIFADNCI